MRVRHGYRINLKRTIGIIYGKCGIYPFHHYHRNTHEVLGCHQGTTEIHLRGSHEKKISIYRLVRLS